MVRQKRGGNAENAVEYDESARRKGVSNLAAARRPGSFPSSRGRTVQRANYTAECARRARYHADWITRVLSCAIGRGHDDPGETWNRAASTRCPHTRAHEPSRFDTMPSHPSAHAWR
jgi:hypothetical protein